MSSKSLALITALLALASPWAQAQHSFPLNTFGGYINVPTVTPRGTVLLHNTNPRPSGSQAYVTGVGSTSMPAHAAGDVLQWAMLARSTKPTAATLNFGVQSGGGDESTLSVRNEMVAQPGAFTWVVSTARVVNAAKPALYFYIPGAIGQEVELKELILGTPATVSAYVAGHPAGNLLLNSSFELPESTVPAGTPLVGINYGATAARSWSFADNGDRTVPHTTQLLASTLSGGGERMMYVKAAGSSDGLFQYFLPSADAGVSEATVSASIYVVSGQVRLQAGRAGGVSHSVPTTATGQWQHLQFNTGGNFITGVFVYAAAGGAEFYVDNVSVTADRAPIAQAGTDRSVNELEAVTLNGSASSDPDHDILTYSWSQIGDDVPVTLAGANTARPTFTAPTVAPGGATITFELTVTANGKSSVDTVDINVVNLNHPPVADAGPDRTLASNSAVAEGSPVTLNGADSHDVDGDSFTYEWVQVDNGAPAVSLTGANTAKPTFTAPVVGSNGAPGVVTTLEFELRVADGFPFDVPAPGYSFDNVTDRVLVEVTNVNNPPQAAAGADQTVGETGIVTLDASGSTDPDGDMLTYSWTQVSGPAVTLAGTTFTVPFVPAGGADLEFELTVSDGYGGTASDRMTVHAQNVNDPPLASAAQPTKAVLWPANHGLTLVGITGVTDPEANATITITGVTQDEPTNGLGDGDTPVDATINPDGTVLLRGERSGAGDGRVYRIAFTATDMEGSASGVVSVTVPKGKKTDVAVDSGEAFDSTR